MARKWSVEEENAGTIELSRLYLSQNLTISEIAPKLGIAESSVFVRLIRLGIPTRPELKTRYRNKRNDIFLPKHSVQLAEFIGIMLGDGHVSHYQVMVTLGTKEYAYVLYVQKVMQELFGVAATISKKKSGYHDVYIGSTIITMWLKGMGLVSNKVATQVGVPSWISSKKSYMRAFVREFFDTDGSVYKLRFGVQISITNHSMPLLLALQSMLKSLEYNVSAISAHRIYITKRADVIRFFEEVRPQNTKHVARFEEFMRR